MIILYHQRVSDVEYDKSKYYYQLNNLTMGEKIKHLREERKLSLQKLADEIDVGKGTLSNVENGSSCTLSTVIDIANYFDVSIDWLCSRSKVSDTDYDLNFVCDYTGLSEKAVEELRRNNAFSLTEVARQTLEKGGDIEPNELNKGDILNAFIEGKYYTNIISYVQDYFVGFKKNKKAIDEFIPEMEKRLGQLKDGSMTTWFDSDIDKLKGIDNGYRSNRYNHFEMQEIVTLFAEDFCKAKKEDYDKAKKRYDDLKGEIEKRVSAHIQSIQKKRKGGKYGNNQETQ